MKDFIGSPMLSDRCLSVLSVCLSVTLVYCGQTAEWIKMKLGMEVGLCYGHIVQMRTELPSPKRHNVPMFGPYLLWLNGWMEVGLGPSDILVTN